MQLTVLYSRRSRYAPLNINNTHYFWFWQGLPAQSSLELGIPWRRSVVPLAKSTPRLKIYNNLLKYKSKIVLKTETQGLEGTRFETD